MVEEKKKSPYFVATGRRKKAVASVYLKKGSGSFQVNGKPISNYFYSELDRNEIAAPFKALGLEGKYDLLIRTKGGGMRGQCSAACLGVARALVKEDEERRATLKTSGYLTRDPRRRERNKPGLTGARKRPQYSKR